MCSKKWAKPDLPGSTSLRDPVSTGICSETMFGKPVGTTITTRPLGSVVVVALNGSTSSPAALAAAAEAAEGNARCRARHAARHAPSRRKWRMGTPEEVFIGEVSGAAERQRE